MRVFPAAAIVCLLLWTAATAGMPMREDLGVFRDDSDVGVPSTIGAGSATYDPATKIYTVSGGGENMWGTADHFHYVWKKVSGDLRLAATIAFTGTKPPDTPPEGHRKACLVIRQTLDPDSVYADAALHGDGLTALQYRDAKGAITREVRADMTAPTRLRLEKRGDEISMWVALEGGELRPAATPVKVEFAGEYYVGLGVCAHNTARLETAAFSDVLLETPQVKALDVKDKR
jgi:TolB protein